MAAKKRATRQAVDAGRKENGNEMESASEDSNEEMDDMLETEVKVDFEARTPDDRDFHGIRRLLQQLFLKAHVDLGELTNEILKQNCVASVVTQSEDPEDMSDDDDEDEIFGLLTVVNLTEKRNLECVKQIKSLLLEKCKANSEDQAKKLSALFEDSSKQVGLIVSERFLNIPPQIALPLYETLQKDMEAAKEKKLKFDFTDYILISKIYKSQQKPAKNEAANGTWGIVYANEEDSLFLDVAEEHFDYSVWEQSDTALGGNWEEDDEEWKTFRRVLLFPAASWASVMTKLQNELKNVA